MKTTDWTYIWGVLALRVSDNWEGDHNHKPDLYWYCILRYMNARGKPM